MKIAVDAMGGDYAPQAIVEGSVLAGRDFGKEVEIILVGNTPRLEEELGKYGDVSTGFRLTVHHAPDVVGMDEHPLLALKRKKNSSVARAIQLVKEGVADAVVTAGNTGAVVTGTKLKLRFLKGIERPAIAATFPTPYGPTVLLDAGANIDCKPLHLLQFAIMGDVFARYILGCRNPRIGLLSVGEEASKGNELTRESFKLLESTRLNFLGNVEGNDIFSHKVDVIVSDGFVGNVVLKTAESMSVALRELLKEEISKNLLRKTGAFLLLPVFKALKRKGDYAEYGGAPLLGVNGTCIIGHGSSSPKAIKNAIRVAKDFVAYKVNCHIEEAVEEYARGK